MNAPVGNWEPSSAVTVATQAQQSAAAEQRKSRLRYGAALAAIAVLFAGAIYLFVGGNDVAPPRQVREITIVNITPPPPPPPPPPPQPEQKMLEQPKMAQPEIKEDKPVEQPKDEPAKDAKNDEPPGPLALDAKAVGPGDLFNLAGKPGGNPYGGGGGGGSRFGWYASLVQTQIRNALDANSRTRKAVLQVQIRLWADGMGRITRVQLVSSTGDAELDSIIRDQVLAGLTLREPPPKDMPMPINTRVTERRPS
jgi:protein TonB